MRLRVLQLLLLSFPEPHQSTPDHTALTQDVSVWFQQAASPWGSQPFLPFALPTLACSSELGMLQRSEPVLGCQLSDFHNPVTVTLHASLSKWDFLGRVLEWEAAISTKGIFLSRVMASFPLAGTSLPTIVTTASPEPVEGDSFGNDTTIFLSQSGIVKVTL